MKKVHRNITIPADLLEILTLERRDINISGVCTKALQEAVGQEPNYEDTRDRTVKRLSDELKKYKGLLKQVRAQRDAAQRKLDKIIAGTKTEKPGKDLNTNTIPSAVKSQLHWDALVFGNGFAEQTTDGKWRRVDPSRLVVRTVNLKGKHCGVQALFEEEGER